MEQIATVLDHAALEHNDGGLGLVAAELVGMAEGLASVAEAVTAQEDRSGQSVWVVTWNHYIHGVFGSESAAEEYVQWRWPEGPGYGVRVDEQVVGSGWDPAGGGRMRGFASASAANGGRRW